jgi:sigma-54 dependent transcriptional regulator, acetoin dehydrogenase operon transcriptional activator AcoR
VRHMSRVRKLNSAAVRAAWTRFCDTGDAGHLRDLPVDIASSWQRSRVHGVDPGLRHFPMSPRGAGWDDNERFLLQHIESALAPFRQDLRDSRALLSVIGVNGRIVFREGNVSTLRAADKIGSVPGALTLESAGGTNSAGTTLYRNQTTWIHGWAHYCEAFWTWSDIGAPIVHPRTGAVLGLIDIGLPDGTLTPALALAAKAIAGSVQHEILARESALNRLLLERWVSLDCGADAAMLAVDRDGVIIYASAGARRLLCDARGVELAANLRAIPAFESIVGALAERNSSTCTVELGATQQQTRVAIEPAIEQDQVVGAIMRFDMPRARSVARNRGWSAHYSFAEVQGESPAFKTAVAFATRLAATDLPVLLHGETGTGKELIAHAIHLASARAAGPFVTVNCGALPQDLIASELFGYEKGAFTGANRAGLRGKFEQADGGTIFLDEITETTAAFQISLLRVIQDGAVVPVGGTEARAVDVRIVSATNRSPEQAVADGFLRSDLFYRLNGAILALPPLRERRDDIPLLIRHFCAQSGRLIEFSPEAMDCLLTHTWPGNLRELHAVVRSAVLLAQGPQVTVSDLPSGVTQGVGVPRHAPETLDLRTAESLAIERAIAACHGNVKQAAALLGIGRSSLYRKLKELELKRSWTR